MSLKYGLDQIRFQKNRLAVNSRIMKIDNGNMTPHIRNITLHIGNITCDIGSMTHHIGNITRHYSIMKSYFRNMKRYIANMMRHSLNMTCYIGKINHCSDSFSRLFSFPNQ